MSARKQEFLRKLRDLLVEYDVSIDAGYEGDTHGIHGEHISITHRLSKDSFKEEEWFRVDYQITLGASDIDLEGN